jgi:hypothetical protein
VARVGQQRDPHPANGENKQFIVKDDTRFTVNGNPATVLDLKKGTVVYAETILEEPMTEITMDTTVVGQAPTPVPAVAQALPAELPPAPAEQARAPAKAVAEAPPACPRPCEDSRART